MRYRKGIMPIQISLNFQAFDRGEEVRELISSKLNPQEEDVLDWEAGRSFHGTAMITQVGAELDGLTSIKIRKLP